MYTLEADTSIRSLYKYTYKLILTARLKIVVCKYNYITTNFTSIGPPGLGGEGQPERGQGS